MGKNDWRGFGLVDTLTELNPEKTYKAELYFPFSILFTQGVAITPQPEAMLTIFLVKRLLQDLKVVIIHFPYAYETWA